MRAQELEPELEALLLRLVPELAGGWQGASLQEIDRIEALAGRPLPRPYRWFLMRMGGSMGPLQYRSLDFSAAQVLSCYEQGLIRRDPRLFMIGYETDEIMPLHLFYDFDHPARDDARVTLIHAMGGARHAQFDTLREMLAWGGLSTLGIGKLPQVCRGSLRGESGAVLSQLDAVMFPLGFKKPIPTGVNCGLYERGDASLSASATPRDPPDHLHFFNFGAADAGTLRRILGVIANESSLEVTIKSWTPPLPAPLTTS